MTALPRLSADAGDSREGLRAYVIVQDDETRSLFAEALAEGGAEVQAEKGDIGGLIDYLADGRTSPPLMVVDLEGSDDPIAEIDRLAEVCHPGTSVIAVGTRNDVQLFRNLVGMGVADYLVKPVSLEDAQSALTQALRPPEAARSDNIARPGRLAVVIGARGGVGASTIAVNTSWLISQRPDQRVALVDLDLHFGTTTFALDLEPGRGLREALESPDRVDGLFIASVAVPANERFHIFGAEEPIEGRFEIDPGALDLLIAELRREFRTIMVDLPRHLMLSTPALLGQTDLVYIVTDLSLAGMRDTMRLLTAVKSLAGEATIKVIANRANASGKGVVSRAEFEKGIEHKIDLILPEDAKAVTTAANAGRPVAAAAKSSKVVQGFRTLAEEVSGTTREKKKKAGLLDRLLKKS